MSVWYGGMLETNVGRAANLALASLPNFALPGDISASRRYYHEDVAFPNFGTQRGLDRVGAAGTGPGRGQGAAGGGHAVRGGLPDTELKVSGGLAAAPIRPGLSFALRAGQPYNRATDPVSP